jgi:hypothetical protein
MRFLASASLAGRVLPSPTDRHGRS